MDGTAGPKQKGLHGPSGKERRLGRPQVSRRILLASKGCSVGPTSRPREHGPWEWLRPKRVVTPHIWRASISSYDEIEYYFLLSNFNLCLIF